MMICLRRDVAWLEVRMNRRRQVAGQTFFGRHFRVVRQRLRRAFAPMNECGFIERVSKEIWAGPLVISLLHWRELDA